MAIHDDIDHTGITGVGGSVATDTIWDAAGDLVQGTGSNTAARLALGTAGQVLKVNAGATAAEWGAAAGGGISGTILVPSSDTYIDSQSTTTNNDGDTDIAIGNAWATASFSRFMLMTFDSSALAGKTIYSAELYIARTDAANASATGRKLEARRVLRAYNPTQVTWNEYSTGNNWTTAGGQSSGNDVSAVFHGGPPMGQVGAVNTFHVLPMAALLKESLDAAETTLRIMLGANVDGNASNQITFAALEHGTAALRPRLLVVHS